LGVGGHLHDYGRRLVLENTSRKETVATLDAKLDAEGHILEMPIAKYDQGYALKKGEVMKVTASYANPGPALPQGAMGIVVGYFAPEKDDVVAVLRRPHAGNKIEPPRLLQFREPAPAKAHGTVVLNIVIGADGKVKDARVARSLGPDPDQKALDTVRQWTFAPARRAGQPVAVQVAIEVNFR
ncbi:MAG TPA: energy transducer TonB, partial [Terriglobales bacterium]|nr:energy transducer TonB [Terriglobales bacterium]